MGRSDSSSLEAESLKNIYSLSLAELQEICKKPYQAKQLYHWLYVCYEKEFAKMSNLPKEFERDVAVTIQRTESKFAHTRSESRWHEKIFVSN